MSPNHLFCTVLHEAVVNVMLEFFDGRDPAFGNMVGEVHEAIISEIPVEDLEGRIREMCRLMRVRASEVVEPMLWCPRCSRRLTPFRCKLICDCGYFMSCSDYV